jgi:hypothetical protein
MGKRFAFILMVLGVVLPVTARAADDHCIFLRTIDGFNVINDEALIVFVGPREAYRVNLFGRCTSLPWTETIAIDSRDGMLCWPSNNHIITGRGERCLVDSVLKLAPPEIDAARQGKLKAAPPTPDSAPKP